MTYEATRKFTSSPASAHGPSQLDLLDGLTTDTCGPAPVPVSRLALPEKGREEMIQGICGRTFIASSVPPETQDSPLLQLWESRLRERLATIGSTESALIWRVKASPAGWSISRLAPSTRHTNGTGSTGSQWSTPRASDGEKGGPNMSFGAGGQPLPAQMHQASPRVTPSARDWKDTPGMATEAGDRNRVDQLPRQMAVNAYHPTPLSLSFKDSHQPGTNRTLEQMKAYMPTPTVAERSAIRGAVAQRHFAPCRPNGTYWSDAEWIVCHDEKARRAKPGLRFLVDGLPGRIDLWRLGGNAIVPQAAAEVLAALREVLDLETVDPAA